MVNGEHISSILFIPFFFNYWTYGEQILNLIGRQERDKKDVELPLFDLATIASATNNFSPEHMIGAGGFGSVYKVLILS